MFDRNVAAFSPETSDFHRSTRRHFPLDGHFRIHCHENFKSRIYKFLMCSTLGRFSAVESNVIGYLEENGCGSFLLSLC
jgi:hypothetical protein